MLKAAIRARLVNSTWQDCLPLVLLGLRSAWKSGPDASPSEMLYGTMLRLPGEFVASPEVNNNSSSSFISEFQARMRSQRAAPSIHHSPGPSPYIPRSLHSALMVLVRHDAVRKPLQKPYDGPYPVLEAGEKYFKILRNGLPYTVSIDRLKPCNMPNEMPRSSIIPNRTPPPAPSSGPSSASTTRGVPAPAAVHQPSAVRSRPRSSSPAKPPAVRIRLQNDDAPSSSGLVDAPGPSVPDLDSSTDFPPLPVYTSSGRRSKPRERLDL